MCTTWSVNAVCDGGSVNIVCGGGGGGAKRVNTVCVTAAAVSVNTVKSVNTICAAAAVVLRV